MKPIDLTLTISQSIPTFPGSPQPQFIFWSTIKDDDYNLELLFLSSHTGTHLDAPYHFVKNGVKIHQIPIERLFGNAILIKILKEKDQAITKKILFHLKRKMEKFQKMHQLYFIQIGKKILKKFLFS